MHLHRFLFILTKISFRIQPKSGHQFTREIFEDAQVVGQADKKFIVAVYPRDGLLFVIDQHAAHERIRLEILLRGKHYEITRNYHKSKYQCENI
jgi:DNA mismatch repair ATPase MutL